MRRLALKYGLIILGILFLYICYLTTTIRFEDRFAHVLYADGQIINAQVSQDHQWRIKCDNEVPAKLETCLLLFEDQYFDYHPGINPISIIKALSDNIKAGKIVRGGSTITMQLARIHEGNRPRTVRQKINEIILSFALELKYSKKQILALYTQHAPYGGNTVGYCAAAHRYYNKDADQLSWSESATLAVLPNAPSKVYPGKREEQLITKRNSLLKKLLELAYIDSLSYRLSLLEGLPSQSNIFPSLSPHLLQEFKKTKKQQYNYYSTLDPSLQLHLNRITQQYRDQYAMTSGIDNIAALILRNDGTVAAYTANTSCPTDCAASVNILESLRSPGSTLKPFLYAGAIQAGMIGPRSLLEDIPVFYNGYSPTNFDKQYRGVVSAEMALTQSLNIPAVKLLKAYGVSSFYDDLQKLSFRSIDKSPEHYGLSIILGGAELKPIELATAYMNLHRSANGQKAIYPRYVEENESNEISFPFTPATSYTILNMLQGVHRPSSEYGWQYFDNQNHISWKTGTSYGLRDAWSVGVNGEYTVLVWVGNADGEGKPGLIGISKAAPILFEVFDLLPTAANLMMPTQGFTDRKICSKSGYAASPNCIHHDSEWLPISSRHLATCKFHKQITYDVSGQYRAYHGCADHTQTKSTFVLPLEIDSYYKKHSGQSHILPPYLSSCKQSTTDLAIIYPEDRSEILLPVDIDQRKQSLIGKVMVANPMDSLYWFLDHELVYLSKNEHKMPIDLSPGPHVLTVVSSTGAEKSHYFTILE